MTPTLINTKSGNTAIIHKRLTTQHAINLHKYNVFHMLFSDNGDSQSGGSENPMRVDNGIRIAEFLSILVRLQDNFSLCQSLC